MRTEAEQSPLSLPSPEEIDEIKVSKSFPSHCEYRFWEKSVELWENGLRRGEERENCHQLTCATIIGLLPPWLPLSLVLELLSAKEEGEERQRRDVVGEGKG